MNGWGGGSKGECDSKGGGEEEWESDIKHQGASWANSPAHSFFFGVFPLFTPLMCLPFLFSFSPHLFPLSPPTPLISSKSSYISSSSSSSPSLPTLTAKKKKKKNQVDLNEQMKRGGEWLHRGSPGKAGSALSGSAFVYSGLPHVKLSECLFTIFFFLQRKTIRHSDHLDVFNLSLPYLEEGNLLLLMVFPQHTVTGTTREGGAEMTAKITRKTSRINNMN